MSGHSPPHSARLAAASDVPGDSGPLSGRGLTRPQVQRRAHSDATTALRKPGAHRTVTHTDVVTATDARLRVTAKCLSPTALHLRRRTEQNIAGRQGEFRGYERNRSRKDRNHARPSPAPPRPSFQPAQARGKYVLGRPVTSRRPSTSKGPLPHSTSDRRTCQARTPRGGVGGTFPRRSHGSVATNPSSKPFRAHLRCARTHVRRTAVRRTPHAKRTRKMRFRRSERFRRMKLVGRVGLEPTADGL